MKPSAKTCCVFILCALLLIPAAALAENELPSLIIADMLSMKEGESVKLKADIKPDSANMPALVWKSSDEETVKVATDGTLTAIKAGKAEITVCAVDESAKPAKCALTVKVVERTPVKGQIEGNVYNSNCAPLGEAIEKEMRDYCEKLGNSEGEKALRAALDYLGQPYDQIDCSKLAQIAYGKAGIKLPRVSDEQAQALAKNVRSDGAAKPGDIYFMKFPSWRTTCSCGTRCRRYMGIHHSAMYLGVIGNRSYVLDSSSRVGKVIIREFYGNMIAGMPVVFVAGK